MSLTSILFGSAAILAGLGGFSLWLYFKLDEGEKSKASWVSCGFAFVFFAATVACFVNGSNQYNLNERETKQSCIDNGGFIYEETGFSACFDRMPVKIQQL